MTLTVITPPASEPVSLSDVKSFLRIDHDDEDTLLDLLITASRLHLEQMLGLAFITQTVREVRDSFHDPMRLSNHGRTYRLGVQPVVSVTSVILRDAAGEAHVWDTDQYLVLGGLEGALIAAPDAHCPVPLRSAAGIEITMVVGFGATAASCPAPLRQALLMQIAQNYELRGEVGAVALSPAVRALTAPYQRVRL